VRKLPRGKELNEVAEKLGVSFHESGLSPGGPENEAIMQARVLAAIRERRDSKTWLIAVISAIGSVFSAVAAWYAVLCAQ
jgi:membrane protein YqaA with SNARE-associated domain